MGIYSTGTIVVAMLLTGDPPYEEMEKLDQVRKKWQGEQIQARQELERARVRLTELERDVEEQGKPDKKARQKELTQAKEAIERAAKRVERLEQELEEAARRRKEEFPRDPLRGPMPPKLPGKPPVPGSGGMDVMAPEAPNPPMPPRTEAFGRGALGGHSTFPPNGPQPWLGVEPSPLGGGSVFAEPVDRETRELMGKERSLESKSWALANGIRTAGPEEREAMQRDLRKVVEQHFEVRQQLRELEINRLERKLKEFRGTLERRHEQREKIIDRRLSELLPDSDHMRF